MLSLIKVRVKLFKSKQFCCCSCFYDLVLVIYGVLILMANVFQENFPKKVYKNGVLNDVNLLSIDNYAKLQIYLEKTSLIVNDKDIGEKLQFL